MPNFKLEAFVYITSGNERVMMMQLDDVTLEKIVHEKLSADGSVAERRPSGEMRITGKRVDLADTPKIETGEAGANRYTSGTAPMREFLSKGGCIV